MTEDGLSPIGPQEQWLRDYVTELGVLVYCFGFVEDAMLSYLSISQSMATNLNPPVPLHDTPVPDLERATLGRVLSVFEQRCTDRDLIRELGRLLDDRNDIIHRTRGFAKRAKEGTLSDDHSGVLEERRRFRDVYERIDRHDRTIRNREGGLLTKYRDTLLERFGSDHDGVRKVSDALEFFGRHHPPPYIYPQPPSGKVQSA